MKLRTNIKKYEALVRTDDGGRRIWTEALQRAIDENERLYIPRGTFCVDASLVLPSNRDILAHRGAEIRLVRGTKTLLLRNERVMDGSYRAIGTDSPCNENIAIKGGRWTEENERRLGYGRSGCYDEDNSLVGVSTCMLFNGVKNLTLSDLVFANTAGFSVQLGRLDGFKIKNVRFENCFADGIHINGFVKDGTVRNVRGETGDDLVALNMYDWENSTISNGPLNNVTVDGIYAPKGGGYKALRIQAGILPVEGGEIDCYVKDLTVRRARGISVIKMYLQTPAYRTAPDGARVGKMENVRLEDIELTVNGPTDEMDNYKNADPLTGHFGAIEIGSDIKGLFLKNVRATINRESYPSTAHLITVGPKSSYVPAEEVELFDPYVTCEVEDLVYEGIRVNGKAVESLREEIYETSFPDDMYESQFGKGGSGKLRKLTRRG